MSPDEFVVNHRIRVFRLFRVVQFNYAVDVSCIGREDLPQLSVVDHDVVALIFRLNMLIEKLMHIKQKDVVSFIVLF